ncbi:hypothetical protein LCGC14_0918600 [marine sediment metagenome]|uniref:Uncharacterized protein n=1 Tax=marine sediment metagenome TaxID=412755 RepID=A0A0F9PC72_9ZZZZ
MTIPICEECKKALMRRCQEHTRCDDCGTREHVVFWVEGVFCNTCHEKLMVKRIAEFKGETMYQNEAVCPWCGYKDNDSWERQAGENECSECGRKFELSIEMTVDYSTTKL